MFVTPNLLIIADETETRLLLSSSGQDRGPGPGVVRRKQRAGHFWSRRTEDKEGNVSDGWSALQRVSHKADGHTEEHQPQLPALHYPQPRKEGELR